MGSPLTSAPGGPALCSGHHVLRLRQKRESTAHRSPKRGGCAFPLGIQRPAPGEEVRGTWREVQIGVGLGAAGGAARPLPSCAQSQSPWNRRGWGPCQRSLLLPALGRGPPSPTGFSWLLCPGGGGEGLVLCSCWLWARLRLCRKSPRRRNCLPRLPADSDRIPLSRAFSVWSSAP